MNKTVQPFRSTSKMAAESYSQDINQHKCVGLFRYSYHRLPKLTMRGVIIYLFFYLYANVQRVKRDIFTADIYYYITSKFGYAKRDLRLAAYDGVVLQGFQFIKVCMGKNGNRHYS